MENSSSSSDKKTAKLDVPLAAIGFEIEELTPKRVTGHLPVTEKACQVRLQLTSLLLDYEQYNSYH